MSFRLGIDLGGTSAKLAIVSPSKKIVREASVPTAGFPRAHLLAKQIGDECRRLLRDVRVTRAGVGVAGDIDFERGVVRVSPNLGWYRVPLRKLIERELKIPVSVDNDAKAAAWGLYNTQIPQSIKHVIVVTLGTGVGGGIILNGAIHRGATNSAGEIGHMNIEADGPLCNCGNRGCLETYVGGPHIVRRAREAIGAGKKTSLRKLFEEDADQLTPHAIAEAARRGDAYARSVWNDAGQTLGSAFGDLVYLYNPQMIVLTGGVSQAKSLILEPMWRTLRKRAFKTPINAVKIFVADKASHVGVIGAALLEPARSH
jgi:glucokinase